MKKDAPFFSVIIPVYNRESLLPETVDTVLAQEFDDFELILVDDKSTDGSLAVCEAYARRDARVRVVALPENQGRNIARNKGVEVARADWICYLDSDDFYYPNHLSTIRRMIAENPEFRAFATEQTWGKEAKKYNRKRFYRDKVVFTFRDFIASNPVSPNQLCHRKDIGLRWVDERLPISEDWLFHRRLALRTPILKYRVLTTDVRIHDKRSLDTTDVNEFIDWNLYAARRFVELEKDLPTPQKHAVLAYTKVFAANVLLSQGQRNRAWKCLCQSLHYFQSWKYILFYKGFLKLLIPENVLTNK